MRRIRADVAVNVGAVHGEGPVWLEADRRLLWLDIPQGHLHKTDPLSLHDDIIDFGQEVGAAVPRARGGLAVATGQRFALLSPDGAVEVTVPVAHPGPGFRFNDGKSDPVGRFLAGTASPEARPGTGSLFCLNPDRTVDTVFRGVTISNGMAWSGDGRTLYYIDTPTGRVDFFEYDLHTGRVANQRTLAIVAKEAGQPDGMAIDNQGCLWVALFGGGAVHRYTPEGRLDTVVNLPVSQVTSCTFGGSGLDELYITTSTLGKPQPPTQALAGAVFVCSPGVGGPAADCFLG